MPFFILLQQYNNNGFLLRKGEDEEIFGVVRAGQYRGLN
jgi:hypothetical protein